MISKHKHIYFCIKENSFAKKEENLKDEKEKENEENEKPKELPEKKKPTTILSYFKEKSLKIKNDD